DVGAHDALELAIRTDQAVLVDVAVDELDLRLEPRPCVQARERDRRELASPEPVSGQEPALTGSSYGADPRLAVGAVRRRVQVPGSAAGHASSSHARRARA